MAWWEWTLLGVAIWALLLWFIVVANHRFWQMAEPRVCLGCQRHHVIIGCPVHDPLGRKA